MAGYIGSKSSVTQVDGYSEAEADAEFVNDPNGAITVDGGNVGIGLTPSSWWSGMKAVETQASSGGVFASASVNGHFLTNAYYDGSNWKYKNNGSAEYYSQTGGTHQFLNVSSGSADGNITWSERMRIDASGNLIIGSATAGGVTSGGKFYTTPSEGMYVASSNNPAGYFNRTGNDGPVVEIRKNNSEVGRISVVGDSIIFGRGDTALAFNDSLDAIYPIHTNGGPRDNAIDLGRSNVRFDDIYATNGTIQTSDYNEKQDIASLTATEMLVGKRISALFKTFRWKDSVAEKGDNARTHTGVIAQDVQAAFTAEGLDAGDYALFISNTWWEHDVDVPAVEAVAEVTDEDGNVTTEAVEAVDAYTRTDNYDTEDEAPEGATSKTRLGIRYPELLSFVAAYNEQRFASIEARLTALEA